MVQPIGGGAPAMPSQVDSPQTFTPYLPPSSSSVGACCVRVSDGRSEVEIPLGIDSLAKFSAWASLDEFPERGRIDYIRGCIEVDMSPEDSFDHSIPKTEIARQLANIVVEADSGLVYVDSMLFRHAGADVSTQPDVMFVSEESLAAERARLVPRAGGEPGKFAVVEGAPDLIVEIVSDSSVSKDLRRLPPAYFAAGVREFWRVDARGEELLFQVFVRGESDWQETAADADGFRRSSVFAKRFRLDRWRDVRECWRYRLNFVDQE
ncbi:MAG TPA: Uma2 family endonuclease [Pirellulales bacterium]